MPAERDWTEELEFALAIAREAGDSTLGLFQSDDLGTQHKGDGSPVTLADKHAERLLRERIAARYPTDGILGEEEGDSTGTSGRRWILDPIDGTVSFVRGVPLYCTLLALEAEGEPVVGVCHLPALHETVSGATDVGAFWHRDGKEAVPARVSSVDTLERSIVCCTGPSYFHASGHGASFDALAHRAEHVRGWSDGYAFAVVATGRAEACVEPFMNVWDDAPFLPILEEAGGRFTDFAGERRVDSGSAVGTNGFVHDEVLALLREAGGA